MQVASLTCSQVVPTLGLGTHWLDTLKVLMLTSSSAKGWTPASGSLGDLDLSPVLVDLVFHQASMLELPEHPHNPPQAISLTMSCSIFCVCLAFSQCHYFNLLSARSTAA